jgi:LPS export ABC transporter protein LptC
MNQRSLLLLALLAVILVLYLSSNQQKPQPPAEDIQAQSKYYLEEFVTRSFGPTGELQRIFQGKTLKQSIHNGETTVDTPRIQLIEADSPTWIISANTAWLDARQEHARLQGNVIANEQSPPHSELKTPELAVNLTDQSAHTSAKVSMTQGTHSIHGEGLQANLPQGTLEILAKVQSVYIP